MREELHSRLGRQPSKEDIPAVLCGPKFVILPADQERYAVLYSADEDFWLFYRMVEAIMTLKEEEERRRQAVDRR